MPQMQTSHAVAAGAGGSLTLALVLMYAQSCLTALKLLPLDMNTAMAFSALILWALSASAQRRGQTLPPFPNGGGDGGAPAAASPDAAPERKA